MTLKSPESTELAKLHEGFIEAFRNNDFEALGKFYTESAVLLPPRKPVVMGRDDILAFWQEAQRILDLRFEPVDVSLLSGDVIREIGKLEVLMRGTGRETRARTAKYVLIWQRTDTGWKITTNAWSSDAAPAGRGGRGGGRRQGGGGGQGDGGGEGRRGARGGGGGGGGRAGGGGGRGQGGGAGGGAGRRGAL